MAAGRQQRKLGELPLRAGSGQARGCGGVVVDRPTRRRSPAARENGRGLRRRSGGGRILEGSSGSAARPKGPAARPNPRRRRVSCACELRGQIGRAHV